MMRWEKPAQRHLPMSTDNLLSVCMSILLLALNVKRLIGHFGYSCCKRPFWLTLLHEFVRILNGRTRGNPRTRATWTKNEFCISLLNQDVTDWWRNDNKWKHQFHTRLFRNSDTEPKQLADGTCFWQQSIPFGALITSSSHFVHPAPPIFPNFYQHQCEFILLPPVVYVFSLFLPNISYFCTEVMWTLLRLWPSLKNGLWCFILSFGIINIAQDIL